MSDAWELLNGKVSVPSELRTAEWSRVPQWIRERQFYSAGVAQANILANFRNEMALISNGASSIEQSRKRIEQFLDSVGYQPEAGQEGTIKDLRSMRRIQVMLRTNVRLLQGWAQKERGLKTLRSSPAWELIRLENRKTHRAWVMRWIRAGGRLYGGRMIALKDDGIWQRLGNGDKDSLGVDYPPFAWGSGMGWRAIGFNECKALGLLEGWTPPAPKPLSSPNETLQTKPRIVEPVMRKALADRMLGLAEWQGDTFVFTDPNGTRPMSAAKLDAVWQRGVTETFHRDTPDGNDQGLFQRHALKLWVEDHTSFERDDSMKPPPGRLDVFDDLLRLFERIEPLAATVPVFRGMAFKAKKTFDAMIARLESLMVYEPLANKPAESWSIAASGARKYAAPGRFKLTLICEKSYGAKDISPLVRSLADEIRNPDPAHPLLTDGEVIFLQGAMFKVTRIERGKITTEGGEVTVYVEQL
ncbi:MAG: hypothetical protein ABIS50_11555 [Luteolibacter sp.]|uniref:hypothetical protein n=1 Tax=Luteolibacter sp. TaxID=1962973 RepID=UPI003266F840